MTTYNYYCLEGEKCTGDGKMICINLEESQIDESMYCPDCGEKLKRVGQKAFTVMGSKAERYAKQADHFKQRAKNHAKSDDGKELKRKAIDKQMGVQGYESAKKNLKEI